MPKVKRRITSCESCRRLRTRCEKLQGFSTCRRCDTLRLQCSFKSSDNAFDEPDIGTSQVPPNPVNDADHSISARLAAVETSISEIRDMLRTKSRVTSPNFSTSSLSDNHAESSDQPEAVPWAAFKYISPLIYHPGLQDGRTAPIQIIRDMKHHILGTSPRALSDDQSKDAVSLGILTEAQSLHVWKGFSSLSPQKYILGADMRSVRDSSPFLFTACLLVGIRTIPSQDNSPLEIALYDHVKQELGAALIHTPLPLESVLALLLISTWNVTPQKFGNYIDTWLLSGMAIMHGMLSFDSDVIYMEEDTPEQELATRHLRTWNRLCLAHLRFSIGTGRPPILDISTLDKSQMFRSTFRKLDIEDQMVLAELKLYLRASQLIGKTSDALLSGSWKAIRQWRQEYIYLDDRDSSQSLRFAYSCVNLILSRYALQSSSASSSPGQISSEHSDLVDLALQHSQHILQRFLYVALMYESPEFTYYPPAYDFLMVTNAAITLIEFPRSLKSIRETLNTMERVHMVFKKSIRFDRVFEWALNVMRRIAVENNQ